MWNYVSYCWQNTIEEKEHYLVVAMAASGVMVVMMVVVMVMLVAAAACKIVVGVVALGGELIDRLDMVGAIVEAVGDVVALLIVYFFVWWQWEQCDNVAPLLVGVRRSRICGESIYSIKMI